jgi:hypothetical protein
MFWLLLITAQGETPETASGYSVFISATLRAGKMIFIPALRRRPVLPRGEGFTPTAANSSPHENAND